LLRGKSLFMAQTCRTRRSSSVRQPLGVKQTKGNHGRFSRMRQRPLMFEHLGQVAHVHPTAAGRAADEVLGLVGRRASDTLADDLAAAEPVGTVRHDSLVRWTMILCRSRGDTAPNSSYAFASAVSRFGALTMPISVALAPPRR
jgi:hypothetical protein